MTQAELIKQTIDKIRTSKFIILFSGLFFGVLLFLYAYLSKPIYTAKATVFPLTNTQENSLTSGGLSSLLGLSGNSKSFSSEASIDIVELALSKNLRESLATTRMPKFSNKTISELLIQNINDNSFFFTKKKKIPTDSIQLMIEGAGMLGNSYTAKVNKNGVLEINFSSTDIALLTPVSEMIVSKISEFYISLRTKKAAADFNFISKKIDSLNNLIDSADNHAILLQNSTYFTQDKLEYSLPKDNLMLDKERLQKQRESGMENQEEALWRLQKVTPIIAMLDKPTPPFLVDSKSATLWFIIGFLIGSTLAVMLMMRTIINSYLKTEISKAFASLTAS